jgi:hypothetical protein
MEVYIPMEMVSLDILILRLKGLLTVIRWCRKMVGAVVSAALIMMGVHDVDHPPSAAVTAGTVASVNLCEGLVSDKRLRLMPSIPKPTPGQAYIDPAFGTTIRRVTNAPSGGVIKPLYSPNQAWNADESYLLLYHTGGGKSAGHSLYDGQTYQYLREVDIAPADIEQVYWDPAHPDVFYYVDNSHRGNQRALMQYHVSSSKKEALHTFACDGDVYADSHAFVSWDSKVLGLTCRGSGGREIFFYDISTGRESPRTRTKGHGTPSVAPSGKLFYWHGKVLDERFNEVRTLDLGNPHEHASLGRLADGRDTYNEVSFDGKHIGSLVTHVMQDGSVRVIIGRRTGYPYPPSGTHVSAVAMQQPGWVAVSSVGDVSGASVLDQELYLANTNPGKEMVCRVAHHRSWGKEGKAGYWAEPHVVISPSGTRLLFGSDWGNSGSVDSYVVELPIYKRGRGTQ